MNREELIAEISKRCPSWVTGTILLRNEKGDIAGYGYLDKGGSVTFSSSPEGVSLLSSSPQSADA